MGLGLTIGSDWTHVLLLGVEGFVKVKTEHTRGLEGVTHWMRIMVLGRSLRRWNMAYSVQKLFVVPRGCGCLIAWSLQV